MSKTVTKTKKTVSMTPSNSPYSFLIQKSQILLESFLVNDYLFAKKYFPTDFSREFSARFTTATLVNTSERQLMELKITRKHQKKLATKQKVTRTTFTKNKKNWTNASINKINNQSNLNFRKISVEQKENPLEQVFVLHWNAS